MPQPMRSAARAVVFVVLVTPLMFAGIDRTLPVAHPFDAGDNGWIVLHLPSVPANPPGFSLPSPPEWVSVGGNPSGHIRFTEESSLLRFWFAAPAGFLGDQRDAYGGTLSFDLHNNQPPDANEAKIALVGTNHTLYREEPDTDQNWRRYHVRLTPDGWRLNHATQGGFVSPTQFQAVLANVRGLYIRGDITAGPDQTSLDNVELCPLVPGDANADSRVDAADLVVFAMCMRGPDAQGPNCAYGEYFPTDFNGDWDVDVEDVAELQRVVGSACR